MENTLGFHGRNRINHAAPNTCDTPTPMSRNVGIGNEMGPGILGAPLNSDPHGRGPRDVVKVTPGRLPEHRPPGLLRDNGPLNASSPHQYGGDPKAPNTYGNVPVEKRR